MPSRNPVHAGGFLYLSGIAAPDNQGDVAAQTRGTLGRVADILTAAGSSLDEVVSVLVVLKSASDFQAMNDAYRGFWKNDFPTRTTVVTELSTPGASVEMSIVATAGGGRSVIHPRDWAASPSPYSYAIQSGDTVFLSGLVSRNGRDNSVVTGDVGTQTRVILDGAGELLKAAGLSHANIVSSRVYIPDVSSFKPMNEAYRAYFPSAPPARATVQTGLAGPQYSVEMTFIASAAASRRAVTEGLPPNLNLPLSAAIVAGNTAYLSGALGNDETNRGNAAAQTKATLEKLRRTLAAAGRQPADVVEAVVYVTDMKFLPDVDREYQAFFGEHVPARTTLRCGLVAPDGLVEILLTAVKQ